MFEAGFPIVMKEVVLGVVENIPKQIYNNCPFATDNEIKYQLEDDEIHFPYRIYLLDVPDSQLVKMSSEEKMVLDCIFSRSYDGNIRQRHIKNILSSEFPNWTIPYIVKVCDEYVVEILQTVYEKLQGKNTDNIKQFCANNQVSFCKSYHRMVSYWNEFYRNDCFLFKNYIGRKLFIECFGASPTM